MITKDDVIAVAAQSTDKPLTELSYYEIVPFLERFAKAIYDKAIEEAVKVCDRLDRKEKNHAAGYGFGYLTFTAQDCAAEIHKLKEQPDANPK